jgi:hypothetical protein
MVCIAEECDVDRIRRQFGRVTLTKQGLNIQKSRVARGFIDVIEKLLRDVHCNDTALFSDGVCEHPGKQPGTGSNIGDSQTAF